MLYLIRDLFVPWTSTQAEVGQGRPISRQPKSPTQPHILPRPHSSPSVPLQASPQRHGISDSGNVPLTIDSLFFPTLHDRLESDCAAAIDTMLRSFATRPHCRSCQRQFLRAFSSTADTPTLPLSGTRVLDLTRVLAGVSVPHEFYSNAMEYTDHVTFS